MNGKVSWIHLVCEASEAGSTASDYAYTWCGSQHILDAERPSEQFEPLGSMIRSLEFQVGLKGIKQTGIRQVGALFELMDAGS